MSASSPNLSNPTAKAESAEPIAWQDDYFRIRDFEYVQPLYDLAFLLEVDAIAKGEEIPKYRTFSLWRAAYSLDGYGCMIDRWLHGAAQDQDLDYVPSTRIKTYLNSVRKTGSIPELRSYRGEKFERCLRLRSVRGLGPAQIASTSLSNSLREEWFSQTVISKLERKRITALFAGTALGPWQTAHVVPPLLRFLRAVDQANGEPILWDLSGISDPFEWINGPVILSARVPWTQLQAAIAKALKQQKQFRSPSTRVEDQTLIKHQMGWTFVIQTNDGNLQYRGILELKDRLDPLGNDAPIDLISDLHMHTAWSDGSASVNTMAGAVVASGLKHFAVTDHSRSSKLQGGLTPILWLRQANALTLANPVCPVLHGIEVDILKDGELDLPRNLLAAADLVIGSVHSSWSEDIRTNTNRLLRALETGCVDILAHPTSAVIGKPGVPDYVRSPAQVDWDQVFNVCARWQVAVELNCFPSRLDLPIHLLQKAVKAGCAISLGSDAHARSHLRNLRFGEAALSRIDAKVLLNRLTYPELKQWIAQSRKKRKSLTRTISRLFQGELSFEPQTSSSCLSIVASIQPPQKVPAGSRIVGIDLTAGDKLTGIAVLDGFHVETCSLSSDEEILAYVKERNPGIVSIDSPLGLPGGGATINPKAGIVRVAENDLASVGIPAYPALIDSMVNLTLRGIRLRKAIEQMPSPPIVIESYPGAAQDILCIPRKQKSLELLREGLGRLGLKGPGLNTRSHDEMDAITSAIVGRYFETGDYEPMGIPSEAQLIVPKVYPLIFECNPVICLAGVTGAGKSVVARYLSVFYGFRWIRTRDVIRELLLDDIDAPPETKMFHKQVDPNAITENDLREFGALILDVYKQVPLRDKLLKMIVNAKSPVVIDAIRDTVDVDRSKLDNQPVFTWFINCNDSIIRNRLADRSKLGQKRLNSASPVDRTAALIRTEADDIIPNIGSLEELRWRVDDVLFSKCSLTLEL